MSQGDLTAELCSMLAVWLVLPFYLLAYLLTYSRADHSDSRGPLLGAARGGGVTFVAGAPAAQRPPRMPPSPPSRRAAVFAAGVAFATATCIAAWLRIVWTSPPSRLRLSSLDAPPSPPPWYIRQYVICICVQYSSSFSSPFIYFT